MINDLFLHEDLSKPENRINVGLFHMLAYPTFGQWVLGKLGLPPTAAIYPTTNVVGTSRRPDMVVRDATSEQVLAWIEVECAVDPGQLASYRRLLRERVIAIWGRPDPRADLSLAEIADFLRGIDTNANPQLRYSVSHLVQLIDEALNGSRSSSSKPAPVADEMRRSPFVAELETVLAGRLS